jgi:hypothetical protein
MATATMAVTVSMTEIAEVTAVVTAAAALLSELGARGEIKSYDIAPARLARSLDHLHAHLSTLRAAEEGEGFVHCRRTDTIEVR